MSGRNGRWSVAYCRSWVWTSRRCGLAWGVRAAVTPASLGSSYMATKRTPIDRPARLEITLEAINLFEAMECTKCTCAPRGWGGKYWEHTLCPGRNRWWKLHSRLHRELGRKPWQWPCIQHPDTV